MAPNTAQKDPPLRLRESEKPEIDYFAGNPFFQGDQTITVSSDTSVSSGESIDLPVLPKVKDGLIKDYSQIHERIDKIKQEIENTKLKGLH